MWASLLATSVMPEFTSLSQLKYEEFLRQLSPLEAKMLQHVYTRSGYEGSNMAFSYEVSDKFKVSREGMCELLNINLEQCGVLVRNLFRLALIDGQGTLGQGTALREFYLTELGLGFMRRCTHFNPYE